MTLFDFDFLADENVDWQEVEWLRAAGVDVEAVIEGPLLGATDRQILAASQQTSRLVLTYDSDFGTLAIRDGEPCLGIVFVRPGNLSADEVTGMLAEATRQIPSLDPPFLLLLEMRSGFSRMRLRRIGPL